MISNECEHDCNIEKHNIISTNNVRNDEILTILKEGGISDVIINKVSNVLQAHETTKNSNKSKNFLKPYEPEELMNEIRHNYSDYVWYYKKFMLWVDNSLDSCREELYQICFIVFVQLFAKLLYHDPRFAMIFLRRFSGVYKLNHSNVLEQLFCCTHFSQLANIPFMKYRSLDFRHTICISRRTRKALNTYLCESDDDRATSIIQNIIQSCIKLRITDEISDSHFPLSSINSKYEEQENELLIYNCSGKTIDRKMNTYQIHWGLPLDLYLDDTCDDQQCKVIGDEPTELVDACNLLPLPANNTDSHIFYKNILKDQAKRRVTVTGEKLPSILCYTLHNSVQLCSLCISQLDGMFFAAAYEDSVIKLWNIAGYEVQKNKNNIQDYEDEYIEKVYTFGNPDDWSGSVDLIGHEGAVFGMCFGEMNKILLSGGVDGFIRLWGIPAISKTKALYRGGGSPVWSIDMGNFGYYFVSGEADQLARFWCTDRSYAVRSFRGHTADVDKVKMHPNCSLVATASAADKTLRLWDVRSANSVRTFHLCCSHYASYECCINVNHRNRHATLNLQSIAISRNGRLIAAAGSNSNGHLWDIGMGLKVGSMHEVTGRVKDIDFSNGSNVLVTGSNDSTLKMYDVSNVARGEAMPEVNIKKSKILSKKKVVRPMKSYGLTDAQIQYVKFTPENVLLLGCVSTQVTI